MKTLDLVSVVLLVVGGLNWGLVGGRLEPRCSTVRCGLDALTAGLCCRWGVGDLAGRNWFPGGMVWAEHSTPPDLSLRNIECNSGFRRRALTRRESGCIGDQHDSRNHSAGVRPTTDRAGKRHRTDNRGRYIGHSHLGSRAAKLWHQHCAARVSNGRCEWR